VSISALPWPCSPALSAMVLTMGEPLVRISLMMAKTSGLMCAQGVALSLVTVMWSRPRNTEVTPSMLRSCAARGEG
jgi:hypothetical protein